MALPSTHTHSILHLSQGSPRTHNAPCTAWHPYTQRSHSLSSSCEYTTAPCPPQHPPPSCSSSAGGPRPPRHPPPPRPRPAAPAAALGSRPQNAAPASARRPGPPHHPRRRPSPAHRQPRRRGGARGVLVRGWGGVGGGGGGAADFTPMSGGSVTAGHSACMQQHSKTLAPHLVYVLHLRQRTSQVGQLLPSRCALLPLLIIVRQRKLAARQLLQPLLLEAQQRLLVRSQALVILYWRGAGGTVRQVQGQGEGSLGQRGESGRSLHRPAGVAGRGAGKQAHAHCPLDSSACIRRQSQALLRSDMAVAGRRRGQGGPARLAGPLRRLGFISRRNGIGVSPPNRRSMKAFALRSCLYSTSRVFLRCRCRNSHKPGP